MAAAACGSDSPSSPSGGNDGTIAATLTITSSGISPKTATVPVGLAGHDRQQRHEIAQHELGPAPRAHAVPGAERRGPDRRSEPHVAEPDDRAGPAACTITTIRTTRAWKATITVQ